jgi:hypothetical protein
VSDDEAARTLWSRDDLEEGEAAYVTGASLISGGLTTTGDEGVFEMSLETGSVVLEQASDDRPFAMVALDDDPARSIFVNLRNANGLRARDWSVRWRAEGDELPTRPESVGVLRDGNGRAIVVASSAYHGVLQGYDLETGELRFTIKRPSPANPIPQKNLARGEDGSLRWLVSPDYGMSAIDVLAIGADGTTTSVGKIEHATSWFIHRADITPDQRHIVIASVRPREMELPCVGLFSLATSSFVSIATPEHRRVIEHVAISPVGTVMATSSGDRLVHVWSLPSGRRIATFAKMPRVASRLVWSEDGTMLIALAAGHARAWDLSGLDARTDAYAALVRGDARPAKDAEAIAGALLYAAAQGKNARVDIGPLIEGASIAALADDFDGRVQSEAKRRATQ